MLVKLVCYLTKMCNQKLLCCALFDFLRAPIQLSLAKFLALFVALKSHVVAYSNLTSSISFLPHKGQAGCCNVTRPFLMQQGWWSANETTSLPACVWLTRSHCFITHNTLCSSAFVTCSSLFENLH